VWLCLTGVLLIIGGCTPGEPPPKATEFDQADPEAGGGERVATESFAEVTEPPPPRGAVAGELMADPSQSIDHVELYRRAFAALEVENVDLAYQLGRQAMRVAPDDPQIIFLMALVLGKRNRFPEAIEMLNDLATREPGLRLPVMGQTAEWMVRFGQYPEAEARYRSLLTEVPDSVLVRRNLAQLLLRQGRRTKAAEHLRFLCNVGDITEGELRSLLAITHPFSEDSSKPAFEPIGALGHARDEISTGEWDAARRRLEALDPIGPDANALLGRVYVNLNDFEALKEWSAGVGEPGHDHPDAWFARGALAAWQGDQAGAVRYFAKTVLRDQTDHAAYARMGRSLDELGMTGEAAESSQRAETIKRTQELGAEMAATNARDPQQLTELIETLMGLRRPLEALAWRGVSLVYGGSAISTSEVKQVLADIESERQQQLVRNRGQAVRPFVLCGVDPEALPSAE
jgi:predicted Zn-dependent protease